MFGPALLLLSLAVFLPRWAMFFVGGSLAWTLAIHLTWRGRAQMNYRAAVRHLRRNEIAEALAVMDSLIQSEPAEADHYRFRAELYRLQGNLSAAECDYRQVVRLTPGSVEGYLGLAEVAIQGGHYQEAAEYLQRALTCAPPDWRIAYTQALLADRRGDAPAALRHAQQALAAGLTDQRLALLVHLWRARGYARLGDLGAAQEALQDLRRAARRLRDWRTILGSPQAAALRAMMGADLEQVEALLNEEGGGALLTRWRDEALVGTDQEVRRERTS